MAVSKKYFHDHFVLLLLSSNAFLAIASAIYTLVSLSTGHNTSYIYQCRNCSDPYAISKHSYGGIINLLSLAVFSLLVLATHTILSFRAYKIHRQLAIAILALGTLLLILMIIISYQLLALRHAR